MALAVAALPPLSILILSQSCSSNANTNLSKFGSSLHFFSYNSRRPSTVVFSNSAEKDSYAEEENSASSYSGNKKKEKPVDTRIHWDNPDEGWIGLDEDSSSDNNDFKLGDVFGDILLDAQNSHYRFLGVAPTADMEEIKAAYRKLSKEYHPDSTSLPLETASKKFVRLKQAYDVLSREEQRRFYDWSLAQEVSSRRSVGGFEGELANDLSPKVPFKSTPDFVDRLGGKNMKLSDQAMTALTFDAFVFLFTIGAIIYAIYFKNE